ncbi:MAG: energy transducer TonB [Bacteroidota bacterium]
MKKIEILEHPIRISEAEIDSYKEYTTILDRHQAHSIKADVFRRLWKGIGLTILTVFVVGSTIYYFLPQGEHIPQQEGDKNVNQSQDQTPPIRDQDPKDTVTLSELTLTEEEKSSNEFRDNDQDEDIATSPVVVDVETKALDNEPEAELSQKKEHLVSPSKKEYIYKDAVPKEGIPNLYEYFETNLKYPESGLLDSIQGDVIVRFTIMKSGEINTIFIEKSLGDLFDEEAVRLIRNMPPWEPASVNGSPVNSRVSVPLHFRIEK